MKTSQRWYLIVSTFFAMFIMAVANSTKGILVPTFKAEFQVTDTAIGTFLTICSLVFIVTTYFGGILCSKIGQKKAIVLSMVISIIGCLLVATSDSFTQVVLAHAVLTVGLALTSIGMNTIIPLLKVAYIGVLMNSLHAFYGIGSTLTQKMSGYLLFNGTPWQMLFKICALLFFIGLVVYLFVKQPQSPEIHQDKATQVIQQKSLLVLCSIALGFYVASEMQTANWLLNYLQEVHHMNSNTGATYLALFFAIFSLGRLVGGFVAEKLGYMKSIIYSMSIALVLFVLGLVTGGMGLYLISLSGLFFAIIFPTFLIVAQDIFSNNPTHATGIITTTASAIAMVIGYLIGHFNDTIGAGQSIYIIPFSMICCIILMIGINKQLQMMNTIPSSALESVQ